MADNWQSLTELAETPASTDDVLVRDISDTTDNAVGTVKRVSRTNLLGGVYVSGGTDVAVADGGTGASDAAAARTNLGAAPTANATFTGTFTVPNDSISYAEIQNVAADKLLGSIAGGDVEEITCTTFGRSLLDDAADSNARTTLGLVIGTDVQAWDAQLDTWATVTPSANGQSLVAAADYAAMRGLLDLEAGTDFYSITAADAAFQPIASDLTALAAAGNSAVLAATTASFLTADETKLDGIEALADVTDATNVAAAGAVMTSGSQLVSAQANNDLSTNPKFWRGTQGEYDALTPTAGEIYLILG